MHLTNILVFTAFGLLFNLLIPPKWRKWTLLGSSVIAIYWMQPATPIRNWDFWFPTASLALTVFVWISTRKPDQDNRRGTIIAAGVLCGIVLLIGLTRYIDFLCCLTPTRPPDMLKIIFTISLVAAAWAVPYFLLPEKQFLSTFTTLIILVIFIIVKTEPLGRSASAMLRTASGQSAEFANPLDLTWLGFSFLAFRLLHVLRDHQSGKLPAYNLLEFVTYAIFFPTYTAGPIDRSERFNTNFSEVTNPDTPTDLGGNPSYRFYGLKRILVGTFKKFVIADSLALLSITGQNVTQIQSTFWAWVLLYAYTLRIYLDFSGYTDIALGLGALMGFKLPENFDKPYRKLNLTSFWNSWHITLAQWFRAYFFNPLTRYLRSSPRGFPVWLIILIGQFTTMVLIGLWHGISWNFFIWGAWHGFGLFINNRWTSWIQPKIENKNHDTWIQPFIKITSWLITINFVALSWVWFALPTINSSLHFFGRLFDL
ncbi:MAG: MBOAT family O-acyltransferase [Anaerolineales bacterium]|jgi:alginate O-acetyltransferase complex protein AlgI